MRWGLLFLIVGFSFQSSAIIFGIDNRQDIVFDSFKNHELAPAIAMSVGNNYALPQPENKFNLDFYLASDSFNVGLCPEERFSKQYANWLNCTGFLVTEDILVTAGHCIVFNHSGAQPALIENGNTSMCSDFSWIFDFKAELNGQVSLLNYDSQQQFASCKNVIYAQITPNRLIENGIAIGEYGLDYSIIRLDHPMLNRKPLRLAEEGTHIGEPVSAVTYPSGLPLKVAGHAQVLQNQFENYFTTNLDISSGSSGGPVFNQKNEVIGIVVRASPVEDYIWDKKRECATSYVCQTIGAGTCNEKNGEGGYPLGTHVHKIEPILKKLRELGLLKTDRLEKQKEIL